MIDHIWPTQVLGENEVAAISSGGTPSRKHPEYFNGEIMWVKSGDLNDSCLFETSETISELGLKQSAAKLLPPNTVLIAMYGATVGKTSLLKHEAATNQAVCTIQPNPSIYNPLFLQYLLILLRQHLLNERYGGAQPNISQTIIRNLELPCPRVSEQENIAAVLWKVQRAIEVEEKLIATARELKQSAMRQLFTRGLQGVAQKETDIGLIPDSWNPRTILELCEIWSGGTPRKSIAEYWSGNVPWVSGKDLKSPSLDDAIDHISVAGVESACRLAPQGAVLLLVRGMGLAKDLPVAVINRPMTFNQDVKALVTRGEYSGRFLRSAIYVGKERLLSRIVPSAHGTMTLNLDDVENFKVACPSDPDEATEIVAIFDALDRKISLHERKRLTLKELFNTLLHQLMTGEIRVADLDIDVSEVTQ
jgi:type I restriction enzyme S subunit